MPDYAIQYPLCQPAMRIITAITNSFPAVVTTSFAHQYLNGLIVRLYIPAYYGMEQANKLSGTITVIDDVTFSLDIDTIPFDPFVVPVLEEHIGDFWFSNKELANVVPFGEVNSQTNGSTQNVLPYPLRPGTYFNTR